MQAMMTGSRDEKHYAGVEVIAKNRVGSVIF